MCEICEVINSYSVSLSYPFPARSPTFTEHPADVTVDRGANTTLRCVAIGLPDPTITLLKNGVTPPIFVFHEISNGVYQFNDIDDTFSAGEYRCNASNTNGYVLSHPATITVRCECAITIIVDLSLCTFISTVYFSCLQ